MLLKVTNEKSDCSCSLFGFGPKKGWGCNGPNGPIQKAYRTGLVHDLNYVTSGLRVYAALE